MEMQLAGALKAQSLFAARDRSRKGEIKVEGEKRERRSDKKQSRKDYYT